MTNQWTDNNNDQWVGNEASQWYDEGWIIYVQGVANYYLMTTDSADFFETEESANYYNTKDSADFFETEESATYYNTDDAAYYLESTP